MYHEHIRVALYQYRNDERVEEYSYMLNHLIEHIFMFIQPESYKQWSEGKKVLDEEKEGYNEIVYEGESEEAYDLLGIDMDEIMGAIRGE